MSAPTVSVVVPAYQNAATVGRTLQSVLAQTWTDFELVIADHSSTDGTGEQIKRYGDDPRVRVLEPTPAGGGAERNWNRVTDAATGRYLKLVCADDLLAPTCLERQVAALQEHPGAGIVAARRDLVDPADRPLLRGRGLGRLAGYVPGPEAVRATVRAGTNLLGEPVCTLLRTDLVRKVGGWSAEQAYLIDEDLYLKVLRHADLVALPEVLASFRISDAQWSVRLATEQARQAAALHARVRAEFPELTAADVLVGNARALRTSWMRRAAYLVWARRMRT